MLCCNWLDSISGNVSDAYVVDIACHLSDTYVNHFMNEWNGLVFRW